MTFLCDADFRESNKIINNCVNFALLLHLRNLFKYCYFYCVTEKGNNSVMCDFSISSRNDIIRHF